MNKRFLYSLALGLIVLLGVASQAKAEDCEQDPVYERSMTGQTTIGSRMRERACMTDSAVITVIPQNAKVNIIAETDGWYKVKYGENTGWVGSRLINAVNKSSIAEQKEAPKETKKVTVKIDKQKVVGVSEQNYSKLKNGFGSLVKQLKNKIIMRVQHLGQLYYVGQDGVLKQISIDELTGYLKDTSKKTSSKPSPTANTSNGNLVLSGSVANGKASLSWTLANMESPMGFKVVVNDEPNPVYPGDDYHYLSDSKTRADTWNDLETGKTYYFRVCEYLGGKCGVYSNNLIIKP